jgi:hypothetical protein
VQQDLSAQDAQQQCRQGLDEMERLERKTHRHHRGIKL